MRQIYRYHAPHRIKTCPKRLGVAPADLVVALPGSHGTLSEIAIALKLGKPIIGVRAWVKLPA